MSAQHEISRQRTALQRAGTILGELARLGVTPQGMSLDSRQVEPGMLFAALPGAHGDGRDYIQAALERGAAAVVWEAAADEASLARLQQGVMSRTAVPCLPVENLAACLGALADSIYQQPSCQLRLIAVTGTNGKTTTTQWLAQLLSLLGQPCGVIGTLGNGLPGRLQASHNTTPDACSLHAALAGMRAQGAQACAMEASSIGIDQGRLDGCSIDTAVFTNLSRDHLEYHGSMAAYAAAKARLFDWPGLRSAVLNLDDAMGRQLMQQLAGSGVRRIGYSLQNPAAQAVEGEQLLWPAELRLSANGVSFTLAGVPFQAPVLGRFNVANLLAVIGALLAAGHALQEIAPLCARLQPPPGRLQQVSLPAQYRVADLPLVVVDYAHTPDALMQTLTVLRELADLRAGRLVCLFGCGGDRDPGKRPMMGQVAEQLADQVMLTSDNPRSEQPAAIVADIRRGMRSEPALELERGRAISRCIGGLAATDVLLIAGKGHEDYQEVAGVRRPFSDVAQAGEALQAWRAATC